MTWSTSTAITISRRLWKRPRKKGSVIKKLMLRQIEPAFLDAMFNVDDV